MGEGRGHMEGPLAASVLGDATGQPYWTPVIVYYLQANQELICNRTIEQ